MSSSYVFLSFASEAPLSVAEQRGVKKPELTCIYLAVLHIPGANISCLLLSLANFISLQTCIGPAFNQLCARSSNFLSRNAFTLLTILLGFFITLKIHPRRLLLAFVMDEAEDEVEG